MDVDRAHLTDSDADRDVLIAEVSGELRTVWWEDMNDGIRGHHAFGFVDHAWRRRCIGWAMHRWFEARDLAIAADHEPDRPRALVSFGEDVDAGDRGCSRADRRAGPAGGRSATTGRRWYRDHDGGQPIHRPKGVLHG